MINKYKLMVIYKCPMKMTMYKKCNIIQWHWYEIIINNVLLILII